MNTSERLRRKLVVELEELKCLTKPEVRDAFLAVPRERFVPAFAATDGLDAVYKNQVVVTKKDAAGGAVSSSSQPTIMAVMLEQLELEPGHRVLEVGAGTGYNAALIKHIVGRTGRVVAVDIDPQTAREARGNLRSNGSSVRVVAGDGRKGFAGGAPYDRIIATASAREIPRAWFRQLTTGGLVVVPLFLREDVFFPQVVVALKKVKAGLESVSVVNGGFMALRDSSDAPAIGVPYIDISMKGAGPDRMIAGLSGEALRTMDDVKVRRLLSIALGEDRRRPVAVKRGDLGLHVFLALVGRPEHQIAAGFGLVDPSAKSFAYIRKNKGRVTLRAAGTEWAEKRLMRMIERWQALGSPNLEDLRIRITYGSTPPRAWRTFRRGKSFVSFDWSTASKRP